MRRSSSLIRPAVTAHHNRGFASGGPVEEFICGVPVKSEEGSDYRARNFSAGPSCVPTQVLRQAQHEFCNWRGTGMGMMEMSHRDAGGPVQGAISEATDAMRELLEVPDTHHVLFLAGGAVSQFAFLPMNFQGDADTIDFLKTGFWGERASVEAAKYAKPHEVYTPCTDMQVVGETKTIASPSDWDITKDAAYVHVCANETISGLEFLEDPELPAGSPKLVGDFTSTLLSRPVDVSKYGAIIASHGKNLGPAGTITIIVEDEWLRSVEPHPLLPAVFDYRQQADSQPLPSLVNTPPTWNIYMAGLVFKDVIKRGGVKYMRDRAAQRSGRIYDLIDNSDSFYVNAVDPKYRSRMTIPLRIKDGDRELEAKFEAEAAQRGLLQLCGHPWFGGLRVTLYNGVEDEWVEDLEVFMKDFLTKYGN